MSQLLILTAIVLGASSCNSDRPADQMPRAANQTPDTDSGSAETDFDDGRVDLDVMIAEPSSVAAGSIVELLFPTALERNVIYVLEQRVEGGWRAGYQLVSSTGGYNRPGPQWAPIDDEFGGVDDIAITTTGPDRVELPDILEPGEYRICSARAPQGVCAMIDVIDP